MERQAIFKRINGILDELSRLQSTLYGMSMTDIQRYLENYETLGTDAALRAEQIACRLRHLLYTSTTIKKAEYMKSAAVVQGLRIENDGGIIEIVFPSLMPGRKQWQSTEFLIDPLYFALEDYTKHHFFQKLADCVVCFAHIYDRELSSRRIRDYDNVELKQVLDVVATFFLVDDSGRFCDTYHTTELGEGDGTHIFLMEKEHFPEWLKARQNRG